MKDFKNHKALWIGHILSVIVCLPFVASAAMKFMKGPEVIQGMSHLGIPESLLLPLGILEFSCIILYLIPSTAVLGSVLFTGYIGGTIITHLRVEENILMQIALGLVIWLGIYLREPRLQKLLPLRKD